jgi:hypothetical protein
MYTIPTHAVICSRLAEIRYQVFARDFSTSLSIYSSEEVSTEELARLISISVTHAIIGVHHDERPQILYDIPLLIRALFPENESLANSVLVHLAGATYGLRELPDSATTQSVLANVFGDIKFARQVAFWFAPYHGKLLTAYGVATIISLGWIHESGGKGGEERELKVASNLRSMVHALFPTDEDFAKSVIHSVQK